MLKQELTDAISEARSAPPGLIYRLRMQTVGEELVSATFNERKNVSERFHVVCSVEDFEGIGSGIRGELTRFGKVSFSCVWPQFERLSTDPLIEVCPIYKAYHQPVPDKNYTLVVACANVGSTTPLVSILTHLIYDRGFEDYEHIQIMAPVIHVDAKAELERRVTLEKVEWSPAQLDTVFGDSWSTVPGVGGNPNVRAGFSSTRERLQFMPDEVRIDLNKRREEIRALRLGSGLSLD
ncbi:hypothetical protein J2W42_000943 [Rhizobium tibeticum]|uniref:hypothetical protein n=1 Tax=Rhizobium tibeticum TaxID=501024 RepID=UPI0027870051|nr:hypothetical protein [Rhizobium tibeticum]MDP9808105.1 hypothetical protein [Rhizobium tibeticum]